MARRRVKGEGSISRRKDGRYEGRYTVQTPTGTKRKAVYGKTRKEAAEKLAKALSRRNAGMGVEGENLLLKDFLGRWMKESVAGSVRPQTFESYERLVRLHLVPALGSTRIRQLSPARVQGLYHAKLEEGLSSRTVQYIHAVLHRALKQAVKWGHVPVNVTDAVDAPKPARRDIRPLTPEQARTLLSVASGERLEALYVVAITAGLCQGELLALRWEDLDLAESRLRVRRTLITGSRPRFG
ncbi:MAG: site-specific integrase, partial [Actinomycetota bacterium]|nr:site-specific integrase [Actinomycetota bacterium]